MVRVSLCQSLFKTRVHEDDISLELVLAPEFRDSASSLSSPYTNELVNSLIKAFVYKHVACGFSRRPYYPIENKDEIDCDHRKNLHVATSISRTLNLNPDVVFCTIFRSCRCYAKAILGTRIMWLRGSEFRKFDIAKFKQVIGQDERTGLIQRHHTDFASRLKSLVPRKSDVGVESGLYRIGRGKKAIYWFWEINYELEYYRQFKTIDLAKGQKVYREERFDLWPEELTDTR